MPMTTQTPVQRVRLALDRLTIPQDLPVTQRHMMEDIVDALRGMLHTLDSVNNRVGDVEGSIDGTDADLTALGDRINDLQDEVREIGSDLDSHHHDDLYA